jgi:hypothetical protein
VSRRTKGLTLIWSYMLICFSGLLVYIAFRLKRSFDFIGDSENRMPICLWRMEWMVFTRLVPMTVPVFAVMDARHTAHILSYAIVSSESAGIYERFLKDTRLSSLRPMVTSLLQSISMIDGESCWMHSCSKSF